jgi:hypothetical protein
MQEVGCGGWVVWGILGYGRYGHLDPDLRPRMGSEPLIGLSLSGGLVWDGLGLLWARVWFLP